MINLEREQSRKTYQLCRMGFFLLSISLVPPALLALLTMVGRLVNHRLLIWLRQTSWNEWVFTSSVWASLVGTMLLWGLWNHKSWQRRTAFLLFMCLVDLVIWFIDRSEGPGQIQTSWFRSNFGQALGWAEFALLASLSGDYLVHLGLNQADDSAKSTRSLAATGAVVWMLHFCEATNWDAGWPLRPRNLGLQGWLLFLGSELIWTITLVQVTTLVVAALRQTNRTLAEIEREEELQPASNDWSSSPSDDWTAPMKDLGTGKETWPASA